MKSMALRRVLQSAGSLGAVLLTGLVSVALAGAVLTLTAAMDVTGPVPPFSATSGGCNGDPGSPARYFPDAELEPYIAVDPSHPNNLIGVWQQDRYSNGGANGLRTAYSIDGGTTWNITAAANLPTFARCEGGNAANGGDYLRASDPWVSIAPNGDAFQISLSASLADTPSGNPPIATAVLVSKSTDHGATWSPVTTIKRDTAPTVFNDKESITADPTDSSGKLAYAVWDRLVSPSEFAGVTGFEHALGFRGPTWFSRTTDGGASWETARIIFDPGEIDQTIGNEIVVLPDGTLVDGFNLIHSNKGPRSIPNFFVALIRSSDKGLTWSKPIIVSSLLAYPTGTANGVFDPNTGERLRTGDIIPQFAVDHASGTLYAVWQDTRFSGGAHDDIAFSQSTDGGRTWSAPVKINQTPVSNIPAFTPSVAVGPSGRVAVTYYDFRFLSPTDTQTLPTDYWIVNCNARCTNPGSWTEQHVAGSFDMRQAAVARGFFTGDYEGLAAAKTSSGSDVFYPFVSMSGCKPATLSCTVTTSGPSDIFASSATGP